PAPTGKPCSSKKPSAPARAMPTTGTARPAPPARPARSAANSSQLVSAAASARAMLSVEGQRSRPSGLWRFDLLKVVGSSPAARASPDAESPRRAANASIARQMWLCCMACLYRQELDYQPMNRKKVQKLLAMVERYFPGAEREAC